MAEMTLNDVAADMRAYSLENGASFSADECAQIARLIGAAIKQREQQAEVSAFSWQPIETAPKNNKRPLFLARFNDDGSLQSFDYDASWMSESESWEIPEVYFFWASANGNVEEPTHWAYQPAGFGKIEAALAAQEDPNG